MTTVNSILTGSLPLALASIALKLHGMRTAANLSLDELSARSGVSKGTLVSLEAGRGNPSVAVLCQVAVALGVSLAELVDFSTEPAPAEFDPAGGKVIWRGKRGSNARLIVGTSGPAMVELWQWKISPGDRYEASAHSPGTRELIQVECGRLGLAVGNWKGTVDAGKGMLLTTDVPHSYWCSGRNATLFRMFVAEWPGRSGR
jgi:transcriptional regulator with XRE-family HTH domain